MTTCRFKKTINRGALLGEISPRPCPQNGLHRLFTSALLTFLFFIFGSPAAWAQPTLHKTRNLLRSEAGIIAAIQPVPRPLASIVEAVDAVGMTVSDMDRSVEFYSKALSFEKVSDVEVAGDDYEHLQGIFGLRMRIVRMRLGDEFIELTEYIAPRGRPIPVDSRSNDRWFQHIAIIVSDMDKAYQRLRQFRVEHASSGPQRLPDWNKNAGGIKAFYFRDPDGHWLEVLNFPPGKGDAKWHNSSGKLFLGIDHTAIVAGDTDTSLKFYRDVLGMQVVGESENHGTEQEHLNNVFGARLRITTLRAERGPGIELLEYLSPRDGRPIPADQRANDLAHWQTKLVVRDAWRVYKIEKKRRGKGDLEFLERVFHKLLLNFNWWVNRKDAEGRNVFQGGFLGLDNIGVFDRSAPLPTGGHIEQADGTSWMGMYCLNMLAIAMELARHDVTYEDVASKFWEHFLYIADAINHLGGEGHSLWNEEDGFYYDVLHLPEGSGFPMKVRSMVGLIPLFAIETIEPELLERLNGFKRRMEWFIDNRKDLTKNVACMRTAGMKERRMMSIVDREQLRRVLSIMLDEREFLSPYGIRALSRCHLDNPYRLQVNGSAHQVRYEPAESSTGLFGGNSNWRGPIWFPVNYLIIESLQKFHHYLGEDYKVECPTGSGQWMTLWEVSQELSRRLTRIFLRGEEGGRPVYGGLRKFQTDPHWRDLILFHEYFHGDNGAGVGANHQTGWTGLVAKLIQQSGE